jgi:hypothetical protein
VGQVRVGLEFIEVVAKPKVVDLCCLFCLKDKNKDLNSK